MAGRLKLQFELEAPMWRLEAANPAAGSKLPCTLRLTLPPGYPGGGGGGYGGAGDFDAEVAAPGSLGREAMKVVSRHAYCRLCEMRSKGAVRGMVDWVQSTELHELAAASFRPRELRGGLVRAFVRYHHVQSTMKRSYMNLWALELGVTALLSAGQPAMLLAIGPEGQLKAFLDRAMKVVHWGPTPSRLVASSSVKPGEMESAPAGQACWRLLRSSPAQCGQALVTTAGTAWTSLAWQRSWAAFTGRRPGSCRCWPRAPSPIRTAGWKRPWTAAGSAMRRRRRSWRREGC
ncbi:unnamed protein product [Effrenium voratum]|uniref:Uncharacterized protein n=1 Tax=Effrenium voratum TaxID=2562239 RepID=A0AA36IS53_9DINO|nr:unnamed protein product [Effrenium voratum]